LPYQSGNGYASQENAPCRPGNRPHQRPQRTRKTDRWQREIERQKLAELIREEEKKVSNLDTSVAKWMRARQYREFISALEES
jgi:hypothetical protein